MEANKAEVIHQVCRNQKHVQQPLPGREACKPRIERLTGIKAGYGQGIPGIDGRGRRERRTSSDLCPWVPCLMTDSLLMKDGLGHEGQGDNAQGNLTRTGGRTRSKGD